MDPRLAFAIVIIVGIAAAFTIAALLLASDADDTSDDLSRQLANSEAFPLPGVAAPNADVATPHSTSIARKGR